MGLQVEGNKWTLETRGWPCTGLHVRKGQMKMSSVCSLSSEEHMVHVGTPPRADNRVLQGQVRPKWGVGSLRQPPASDFHTGDGARRPPLQEADCHVTGNGKKSKTTGPPNNREFSKIISMHPYNLKSTFAKYIAELYFNNMEM